MSSKLGLGSCSRDAGYWSGKRAIWSAMYAWYASVPNMGTGPSGSSTV